MRARHVVAMLTLLLPACDSAEGGPGAPGATAPTGPKDPCRPRDASTSGACPIPACGECPPGCASFDIASIVDQDARCSRRVAVCVAPGHISTEVGCFERADDGLVMCGPVSLFSSRSPEWKKHDGVETTASCGD